MKRIKDVYGCLSCFLRQKTKINIKRKLGETREDEIIYELKKLETNKYYFSLKWAGELKGTFYYINGKFDKLKYVQSTD